MCQTIIMIMMIIIIIINRNWIKYIGPEMKKIESNRSIESLSLIERRIIILSLWIQVISILSFTIGKNSFILKFIFVHMHFCQHYPSMSKKREKCFTFLTRSKNDKNIINNNNDKRQANLHFSVFLVNFLICKEFLTLLLQLLPKTMSIILSLGFFGTLLLHNGYACLCVCIRFHSTTTTQIC